MDNLLKYQTIDSEIVKITNELNQSQDKKQANQLIGKSKEDQARLLVLDKKALQLKKESETLNANFEHAFKEIETLTKEDLSKFKEEQAKKSADKIKELAGYLTSIERNLGSVMAQIKATLEEFELIKQRINASRAKIKILKDSFEEKSAKLAPEIENYKKQLTALEKNIEPALLDKYKKKRADNIFPVFVELNVGKNCGYCRMEFALGQLNKINTAKTAECEHCRRINFVK